MHTNINRSFRYPLFLKVEDLKVLWDLLADSYGDVKAVLVCVDGSELHTTLFSELEQYENPTFRKITQLNLRCGEYLGPTCSVKIGEALFSTTSLTISDDTDDKRALKVADEFGKRARECRPFYWFICYLKPTLVIWALSFLWATVTVWRTYLSSGQLPESKVGFIFMVYLLVPILALFFLAGSYLDRAWTWMFPKIWFHLGRQAADYQRRVSVRYWVFGGVALSIILSIVANLLTNAITN